MLIPSSPCRCSRSSFVAPLLTDTLGSVAAMVGVRLYIAAAASHRATFRSVVALIGALAAIIIGTLCKEVTLLRLTGRSSLKEDHPLNGY